MMNVKHVGVSAILLASMMWALEPILAKLSYRNANFLETSAIRAIFVTLTALGYTGLRRKQTLAVGRRQLAVLVYIAIAGTLVADLVYFLALTRVPIINAVLIGHMQPVFIVLLAFFFLREDRLARFDWVGVAFMIMAAFLVTTRTIGNFISLKFGSSGDLLVLAATIAWATTAIAMRRYLRGMSPGVMAFYRYLFASAVFAIYLISTSGIRIANVYQVLVGIVAGIGTVMYYEALTRIKAAQVSALELSTPFFAAILAFFVLGELVTTLQIIGIFSLFVGIYCLSKREEKAALQNDSL